MFDVMPPGPAALHAPNITASEESLTVGLTSASGLDDAGRVEPITALEELVRVATATQAALARERATSPRSAAATPPASTQPRS